MTAAVPSTVRPDPLKPAGVDKLVVVGNGVRRLKVEAKEDDQEKAYKEHFVS